MPNAPLFRDASPTSLGFAGWGSPQGRPLAEARALALQGEAVPTDWGNMVAGILAQGSPSPSHAPVDRSLIVEPARVRIEAVKAMRRGAPRAVTPLVTVLCAGGFLSTVPAGREVLDHLPHGAVNQIVIPLGHPRQVSPWTVAEDEDVLTRSGAEAMGAPAQEALARIRHLGALGAGWDGTDVDAPNPDAMSDGMTLITKLANAGASLRPTIGLESDGTLGFAFYRDDRVIADMTIPGDKTYSYFAQNGGPPASCDDARIGSPIPRDLLDILTA